MTKPFSLQINVVCKYLVFWQQTLEGFNNDIGGKGENLESEKLIHFLNILDSQFWSQQVLSRTVGNF